MDYKHTAFYKKELSTPSKWLLDQGLIEAPALDFGCGDLEKTLDLGIIHCDPFLRPENGYTALRECFQTVVCNYVLCVLPEYSRIRLLEDAYACLRPGGVLYITVRRDLPPGTDGPTPSGWKAYVVLHVPMVHHRRRRFCIHKYERPR